MTQINKKYVLIPSNYIDYNEMIMNYIQKNIQKKTSINTKIDTKIYKARRHTNGNIRNCL
jgi:uncharacterized membrane protein required for colicin V production